MYGSFVFWETYCTDGLGLDMSNVEAKIIDPQQVMLLRECRAVAPATLTADLDVGVYVGICGQIASGVASSAEQVPPG